MLFSGRENRWLFRFGMSFHHSNSSNRSEMADRYGTIALCAIAAIPRPAALTLPALRCIERLAGNCSLPRSNELAITKNVESRVGGTIAWRGTSDCLTALLMTGLRRHSLRFATDWEKGKHNKKGEERFSMKKGKNICPWEGITIALQGFLTTHDRTIEKGGTTNEAL